MAIEIDGFNDSDILPTQEAAHLASELAQHEGVHNGFAYTIGQRAGEYAAGIIFTALREMGVIPPAGFDLEDFRRTVRAVVDKSLNPR